MVLYGIAAGVSISSLFIAGILPGVLMVVLLIAVGYWQSVKAGYPAGERASVRSSAVPRDVPSWHC